MVNVPIIIQVLHRAGIKACPHQFVIRLKTALDSMAGSQVAQFDARQRCPLHLDVLVVDHLIKRAIELNDNSFPQFTATDHVTSSSLSIILSALLAPEQPGPQS
ncbi:hypothetical protein ES703_93391 [subsurface metagenome]